VQDFYFPKVVIFNAVFIAKLIGAASFSAANLWSTLFLISRFASAILMKKSAAGIITFGILTVFSAYPTLVAYITFTLFFVDTFAPDMRMQHKNRCRCGASYFFGDTCHETIHKVVGIKVRISKHPFSS
jgi:hypothetical protein